MPYPFATVKRNSKGYLGIIYNEMHVFVTFSLDGIFWYFLNKVVYYGHEF